MNVEPQSELFNPLRADQEEPMSHWYDARRQALVLKWKGATPGRVHRWAEAVKQALGKEKPAR